MTKRFRGRVTLKCQFIRICNSTQSLREYSKMIYNRHNDLIQLHHNNTLIIPFRKPSSKSRLQKLTYNNGNYKHIGMEESSAQVICVTFEELKTLVFMQIYTMM